MAAVGMLDSPVLERAAVSPRDPLETAARSEARAFAEPQLFVNHDLAAAEQDWIRFQTGADCTVFQSYEWLSTWFKHVGAPAGHVPAIVTGRGANDQILFILPLAIEPAGPLRRLTFLGREYGDYNAPLLAPGFAALVGDRFPQLWKAVLALLRADPRGRHDLVMLDKMPAVIGQQQNPFLALDTRPNPSGAYLTALTGDWEGFYAAKRSSSSQRRDRNKRKRLAECGSIDLVSPTERGDAERTLATLIAQKRRSFERMGVKDIFSRPGCEPFFHDLTTGERTRAIVHVSHLDVGGLAAATNLGLVFRGRYYHVLASYDDGPISKFGPGGAHLQALMAYAIERKCTVFDFTIGDEPYKRDWCDVELALHDHFQAATWKGATVASLLSAGQRIKRAIKQSNWLWPLATRLRAKLGSWKQPKRS